MPACATRVTQDRCSAGSERNQGSRSSISATDLVARLPPARSTRRRVSALTPGAQDLLGSSEDVAARSIDDGVGPDTAGGLEPTGAAALIGRAIGAGLRHRSPWHGCTACHPGQPGVGPGDQAGAGTSGGADPVLMVLP